MSEQVNLEQGSKEWLEFRNEHLGASDAPVVMNQSPFKTPFQLYLEKRGEGEKGKPISTLIAGRGHYREEIVRDRYNSANQTDMQPAVFVEGFLHASLDGYDEKAAGALEAKNANKEDHTGVICGEIPTKYLWQIIQQLIVAPVQWVDYCSYYVEKDGDEEKGDLKVIRTYYTKVDELRRIYNQEAKDFWDRIQNGNPPEFTDEDFVPINDEGLRAVLSKLRTETIALKEKEKVIVDLKAKVTPYLEKSKYKRHGAGDIKITKVTKVGSVDYKKFLKDALDVKDEDLEEYRKPGSSYYKYTFPTETDD